MRARIPTVLTFTFVLAAAALSAAATTYEVGTGFPYPTPAAVPWEGLQAGDIVLIHWRATPYRDKWVVTGQGTFTAPIVIRGVPGPGGELPVVDGNGATTRLALDYWSESRAVIKIGGASVPTDTMPQYITIENLDVRSARPPYTFTDHRGDVQAYAPNAAGIYIEKGEHITLRNNRVHDNGNGITVGSEEPYVSRDIVIEGNAILDNGNIGSPTEHNTYTEALGITFQFNYLGPPKSGAGSSNLKDRSAGLVVRYNWIEGGHRQMDLVDADSTTILSSLAYRQTHVYGNVLVEPADAGSEQITHYGGDSGTTSKYRKGTLLFYNNTVVSYRTDKTILFRLDTNDERADARNNIFYATAAGSTLSLTWSPGMLDLRHNWFKSGWRRTIWNVSGSITGDGTSIVGSEPGFLDEAGRDFRLAAASAALNAGTALPSSVSAENEPVSQYMKHQVGRARVSDGVLDLGAFEREESQPVHPPPPAPDLVILPATLPAGMAGTAYSATLNASGGTAPYAWSLAGGTLPNGLTLSSGGALTGTPSAAGTWSVMVRATDAQFVPDTATVAVSIAIASPPPPPPSPLTITTGTKLPAARRNTAYSAALTAVGGAGARTWSVESGSLPPGLAIDAAAGVIGGRPTKIGTYTFTVRVRDGQATPASASTTLSITVRFF